MNDEGREQASEWYWESGIGKLVPNIFFEPASRLSVLFIRIIIIIFAIIILKIKRWKI